MKASWETKRLDDICNIEYGTRVVNKRDGGSIYPVYGGGGATFAMDKYNRENCFVVARFAMSEQCTRFVFGRFFLNDSGLTVSPKNGDILQRFLDYQMLALNDEIYQLAKGAAQKNLDVPAFRNLKLAIATDKLEQQRIVSILDEAFDGIANAKANAEKNLKYTRELFESHLQSVFTQRGDGWVERTLGELATFRNGINFTKSSKGESIKILGVKDFQNNYWAPLDDIESVIPEGRLPESDILQKDDLIFVRSNGNPELIGRCLLTGDVTERTTHSGFTIRARLHTTEISSTYLCHFLKSEKAHRKMIDGGNGVNIKSLNQGTLSSLVIPFPISLVEQKHIVIQLESIQGQAQRLQSIYQQKITALDELKKSLLHKAFSGEL